MALGICGKPECGKLLSHRRQHVQCCSCFQEFHIKCSLPTKDFVTLIEKCVGFYCALCRHTIFPFNDLVTDDLLQLFNENVFADNILAKKCKCGYWKKNIKRNMPAAHCLECSNYFHLKCEQLCKKDFPLNETWICAHCICKTLPFSKITDNDMNLTNHGLDNETIFYLEQRTSSFSMRSLLDQIPGQKFDSDQFISDSMTSCLQNFQIQNSQFSTLILLHFRNIFMNFAPCYHVLTIILILFVYQKLDFMTKPPCRMWRSRAMISFTILLLVNAVV